MLDPCVAADCVLSYSKRTEAARKLGCETGSLVFAGFSKYRRPLHKHYMSDHLRVVAVVSSGTGSQGNFQWFIGFPWSFRRTFHTWERKWERSYTSWVWVWDLSANGVSLPGNTGSAGLHLLLCSFNDFCFLIGLMSLSLVLRALSGFKLVSFHSSGYLNQYLQLPE